MQSAQDSRLYWWALVIITVFLCLPIVTATYLPLVDWANHLARIHIIHNYSQVPVFQERYVVAFEPIPNMAMDLIIAFLLNFTDILTAGKIYLVLTIVLFVAGCHLLGKAAFGSLNWMTLPCCFLIYSSPLIWGFGNYLFGLSLFCLALAFWLRWRERWTVGRLLVVTALVFGAFISHLSTYCFLGIAFSVVSAVELYTRKQNLIETGKGLLPLIPPFVAFAVFMTGSGSVGVVKWDTLVKKVISVLLPFISYNYVLDAILLGVLAVILILLFFKAESVSFNRLLLAVGLVYFTCFLVFPRTLFTSEDVDDRFVVPAFILILLSLKFNISQKTGRLLLASGILVLSIHVISIWSSWVFFEKRIAAEVKRFDVIAEEARVYPIHIIKNPTLTESKEEATFWYILNYATITRKAYNPSLFAFDGQNPLRFRVKPLSKRGDTEGDEASLQNFSLPPEYDYVWTSGMTEPMRQYLTQRCVLIYEADRFALWQIK